MEKLDLEQLKMYKELFSPTVATGFVHRREEDKDTFATFTGGLRQNWVFVMALFGMGFWIVTNVLENKTMNVTQDAKIQESAQAIINLNKDFDDRKVIVDERFAQNSIINNEIIRRLDNLAKDIEIIKSKR